MDPSGILHHPVFESVVLPLALAFVLTAILRATAGPSRAGAAVGVAMLAGMAWMSGWSMPASAMQKLPWIVGLAWVVGLALDRGRSGDFLRWLVLLVCWVAASWWLGTAGAGQAVAFAVLGALVIALQLRSAPDRADGVSMAVIAALGLAGLAFQAGSLALFQLSLMLAASLGGAALWLWPRSRILYGTAAVAVASIGWLALAQATVLLLPARPAALGLLALAFAAAAVAAPVLRRIAVRSRGLASPLVVASLAAATVAAGLSLQDVAGPGQERRQAGPAAGGDGDAYYPAK
jgi:hypothetical protein